MQVKCSSFEYRVKKEEKMNYKIFLFISQPNVLIFVHLFIAFMYHSAAHRKFWNFSDALFIFKFRII